MNKTNKESKTKTHKQTNGHKTLENQFDLVLEKHPIRTMY